MSTSREKSGSHHHGKESKLPERSAELQSKIEQLYQNFGESLGWYNRTTDQNKLADAEMMLVTGCDVEFLLMHHHVRDLLEANKIWGGILFEGYKEPKDIYAKLDGKSPMPVRLLGEDRKPLLDADGKPTNKTVDLREMARLIKIEEHNRYLGNKKIPTDILRRRFLYGQSLTADISGEGEGEAENRLAKGQERERLFNLLNDKFPKSKDDDNFDFDKYIDFIEKHQLGFQYLGSLRDEVLDKHHIENASHVIFLETNRTKANGNRLYLWMPVSGTIAQDDARADLQKKDATFKAAGHVHEVGHYCEDNGTTVKFNAQMLKRHRAEISLRQVEKTNPRMAHAAVGLERDENMTIVKKKVPGYKNGEEEISVAVVGGNRKGKIYDGLHHTYDKAMIETRGEALTDEEADDLIFTDIIAPFIYANATDWLLCFAKSAGNELGYKAEKAVQKKGERWSEYGDGEGSNFCVAIPCRPEDADEPKEEGLKYFLNYNDLIAYVNERIKAADIEGVNSKARIKYEGMTKAQVDQELNDATADEQEPEDMENMEYDEQRLMIDFMVKLFPGNVDDVLQVLANEGSGANVVAEGATTNFVLYVHKKLQSAEVFDQVTAIAGTTDKSEQNKRFLAKIKGMKKELWNDILQLKKTGKEQPKRAELEIDKEIKKIIDSEQPGMADFAAAVGICEPIIKKFDSKFAEEVALAPGSKLSVVILQGDGWKTVMYKVAQIMGACHKNKKIKQSIGSKNIQNPQWLLRQALILSGKSELIKKLGL